MLYSQLSVSQGLGGFKRFWWFSAYPIYFMYPIHIIYPAVAFALSSATDRFQETAQEDGKKKKKKKCINPWIDIHALLTKSKWQDCFLS